MRHREWALSELAVLEAAERGLDKSGRGRRFDPEVFRAVAEMELTKLREEIGGERS